MVTKIILESNKKRTEKTKTKTKKNKKMIGFDPIWWLYQSNVQMHRTLWQACHGYFEISMTNLQLNSNAYSIYCDNNNNNRNNQTYCINYKNEKENQNNSSINNYDMYDMNMDSTIKYNELLTNDVYWSFVSQQDITIRKLYDNKAWNIIYDLGNQNNFYFKSGLSQFCEIKSLTDEYFKISENLMNGITNNNNNNNGNNMFYDITHLGTQLVWLILATIGSIGIVIILFFVFKSCFSKEEYMDQEMFERRNNAVILSLHQYGAV